MFSPHFQSFLNTHSSLKSGTLELDLSSTAISGLATGRDENIQMLPDMSDSEVNIIIISGTYLYKRYGIN